MDDLATMARADDAAGLRAALAGDPDRLAAMLPDGTDLLMAAAGAGAAAAVAVLLELGADAGRRDAAGRVAADHARAGGHADLARRLQPDVVADQVLR